MDLTPLIDRRSRTHNAKRHTMDLSAKLDRKQKAAVKRARVARDYDDVDNDISRYCR